ncbi:MAG: cytochrome c family protein [Desulfobulbaceae bacterium]|nr:cytochrome c family protein [Desulfobulbaceae bacterium]
MIGTFFNKIYKIILSLLLLLNSPVFSVASHADSTATKNVPPSPTYVGSLKCKPCHATEYNNFVNYAKKSNSYRSIERLEKGLSDEDLKKCYSCHTTGYGKPSGFVSVEKTPHLKNAGCEVCHGPGSQHVEHRSTESILRLPTIKLCYTCHTSERLRAFRFTPLIHGGGH